MQYAVNKPNVRKPSLFRFANSSGCLRGHTLTIPSLRSSTRTAAGASASSHSTSARLQACAQQCFTCFGAVPRRSPQATRNGRGLRNTRALNQSSAASRRHPGPSAAADAPVGDEDVSRVTVDVVVPLWDESHPDYEALRQACEAGLPDVDVCSLDLIPPSSRTSDTIAMSAKLMLEKSSQSSVAVEAWSRAKWLLGLLVLQSSSSLILNQYEGLIRDHLVVTLFLTMLVGAGGNAGNQSAIKIIRGLATGKIQTTSASMRKSLMQQTKVGLILATLLSLGGFARVYMTNGNLLDASSISMALFAIVITSVVIGSGLPFVLAKAGVDPANAGTSIQVVMDVLGVGITCITCDFVLNRLSTSLGYIAS